MPSLLRCSSQPYYLIPKRLGPRKPHNSAVVGTLTLPEFKKKNQTISKKRPQTVMVGEIGF